jgi:hypothetical protein
MKRELSGARERGDLDGRTECGLAVRNGQLQNQIIAIALKEAMAPNGDEAVAVTGRATVGTGLTRPRQSHSIVIINTGGNVNVNSFFARGVTTAATLITGIRDD